MTEGTLPSSVGYGEFTLFGVVMKCHVLSDGRRIIEAESMEKLFEAMAEPGCAVLDEDEIARYARWSRGEGES